MYTDACALARIGEVCRKGKRPSERDYYCKKPKNCATFKRSVENGNVPAMCSFDRLQPVVCCPSAAAINNETAISSGNKIRNSNTADKSTCNYYYCAPYNGKIIIKIFAYSCNRVHNSIICICSVSSVFGIEFSNVAHFPNFNRGRCRS